MVHNRKKRLILNYVKRCKYLYISVIFISGSYQLGSSCIYTEDCFEAGHLKLDRPFDVLLQAFCAESTGIFCEIYQPLAMRFHDTRFFSGTKNRVTWGLAEPTALCRYQLGSSCIYTEDCFEARHLKLDGPFDVLFLCKL